MNIGAFISFCYLHIWALFVYLVLAYIILMSAGVIVQTLFSRGHRLMSSILTAILSIISIPLQVGFFIWVIMFVVCAGHWIGMY